MITDYNGHDTVLFSRGELVFKVIEKRDGKTKYETMVTTMKDYEYILSSHQFTPLLFVCGFPERMAYLYGCLNNELHTPKTSKYIFYSRRIGEKEWKRWFTVEPYTEEIYGSHRFNKN